MIQDYSGKSETGKGRDDSGSVKLFFCLTSVISKYIDAALRVRVQQGGETS